MNILIIGANSDIAQALIRELVKDHSHQLMLASRHMNELAKFGADMAQKCPNPISLHYLDVTNISSHHMFVNHLKIVPDCVIYAAGYLGPDALKIIETNYTGAVSLIELLTEKMHKDKPGLIVGLSSVAGIRGRGSNYLYGSAKAGFTTYLNGLRARLSRTKIHVLTVILGLVKTKMTAGHTAPDQLTATPEQVAKAILYAVKKQKNIVYATPIWRVIMFVIRIIPESVFKFTQF